MSSGKPTKPVHVIKANSLVMPAEGNDDHNDFCYESSNNGLELRPDAGSTDQPTADTVVVERSGPYTVKEAPNCELGRHRYVDKKCDGYDEFDERMIYRSSWPLLAR